MPICKKCNQRFPCHVNIENKSRNLSSRKYCLDCSPFGLHNTKPLHNVVDKKSNTHCQQCGKELPEEWNKPKCGVCYVNNHRKNKRQWAIDHKGGCCCLCGYNKTNRSLCFHHLNEDEKEIRLSSDHTVSWERLKKELDKCILVCANCHGEIHAGLVDLCSVVEKMGL